MASQNKPWKYFLIDETGKSYRKEMGLIVAKASRAPLKYTPGGWQDLSIAWERDLEKWGINRNFSLPLGFVLDGADIVRSLIYKGNFEKKVYLLIQKQYLVLAILDNSYYFYYDLFYKGQLDLTTAVDEEDKVSINVNEGGILQDIKANEGTVYEIPCDEITIRMDGVTLFETVDMYTVENSVLSKSLDTDSFIIPLFPFAQETSHPGMAFVQETVQPTGNSVDYVNNVANTNYFGIADLNNNGNLDLHVKGTLRYHCTTNDLPFLLVLRFMTSTMTLANQSAYQVYSADPVAGQDYTIPIDIHIPIKPGEKIFLRAAVAGGTTGAIDLKFHFLANSFFTIDYSYRKAPTFIKADYPLTVFKRLVGKMNGNQNNAVSTLLASNRNLAIASGDSIRGIPNSVVKIKFADFYSSINAQLMTSQQVKNGKVYIETLADSLESTNPIVLGQVKEIKVQRATELLVNTVKVGYPPQTYNDVNGKQEVNNTSVYTSDVKKITKELDLTSVIRGDSLGAEFTRINLDGKKTTDASTDNDVWFLDIDIDHPQSDPEHGVYYNLFRDTYDVITGLLSPATMFNLRITPARMLAKHKPYLNSVFYGFEGTKLVFQTTDKNRELYTKKGMEIVDEDADVVIDGVGRLFKTFTFDLKPQTPVRLAESLATDPNRCFSFEHYNGHVYTGYNLKVGLAVDSLESQAYLLLSSPSNDLILLTT